MENQKDDILMKVRSSRGCIGAGYRLYTGNFKRIFRYSWVAALFYALVCSVGGTLMVFRPQAFPITVTIILVAEALFTSYGFAVLKKHQETGSIPMTNKWFSIDTHIFIRTLKAWLCLIVIYLFVAVVIGGDLNKPRASSAASGGYFALRRETAPHRYVFIFICYNLYV